MTKWEGWLYWGFCMLVAVAVLFPVGLLLVGWCCWRRDYTLPSSASPLSIKPLPKRLHIDAWGWGWMNAVYGNPEDGVTGFCAYGPSWTGAYNPARSRWVAFVWSGLRNWADGFNYVTWPEEDAPNAPNYQTPYTVPKWVPKIGGTVRTPRLGWQQLPASDGWTGPYRCRMVCSL